MNIGIDIKAFKNGATGIARYLRNMMDHLQRLDSVNNYYLFECTSSGYVVTSPLWKKVLIPWKLPGIFWQQCILPPVLKRHSITVLWAPEQICPVLYRGTILTTVHDLTALRYPHSCQRSNYLIQKYLFPRTIERSALLMPVSDFVGRELVACYPERIRPERLKTVSNGSPDWETRHEPASRADPPFLFFAGNREPRKNLLRLVEALELLHGRGTTVALHLAGPPGWKNHAVDRRIADGPLRDSITCLGYLSEEELREQYRRCSAVVYPSVYEGFGLPVLEAFRMGARVITSRGTVMEEIAGAAARYFDPFDSNDIARAIEETLSLAPPGKEEYRLFEEVLDKYSWEKSALLLLEAFTKAGSPRGVPCP